MASNRSYHRTLLGAGSVAAALLAMATTAGALPVGGGDPPPPPPPPPPTTTTKPPSPLPPVFHGSPRYKLEAISFTADDESGWDFLGSDEPVFVFTSDDGAARVTTKSQAFGDVDSGDTFSFTTGKCLVANCTTGVAGPLALTTQLIESDGGSEAEIRDKVKYGVTALHWALKVFGIDSSSFDSTIEDYFTSLFSDDLMGSANQTWTSTRLAQSLTTVGSSMLETVHLGEHGGDLPDWLDNPPDYTLRLRITRMADAPIVATQ
jgi:hypothetical protein